MCWKECELIGARAIVSQNECFNTATALVGRRNLKLLTAQGTVTVSCALARSYRTTALAHLTVLSRNILAALGMCALPPFELDSRSLRPREVSETGAKQSCERALEARVERQKMYLARPSPLWKEHQASRLAKGVIRQNAW